MISPNSHSEDLLTENELVCVIEAYLTGEGEPRTEEQIEEAVEWARGVKIESAFLGLMVEGDLMMRKRENGEWEFQAREPRRKPILP